MPGAEKIRVVIVDDIAETRENIRRLLQFEADFEVIGTARTGKEAIDVAQETKPDVVLMDINMPDMDGIQATEAIRRKIPFTQIIILSVQGDPNYMRRAMLAGARDFLTKPPNFDELSAAIRRAGAMAHEERAKITTSATSGPSAGGPSGANQPSIMSGKIVMVYSPKGGTGCTTIATNLAVGFKNEETKVALIDGNLQFGDIAVFLNEQGKNTILDLAPRADELDPDIIAEVMVTHSASGINILAAPSRPEMAEKVTGDQFAKVLQYLRNLYTYIVIDTSSYLTDIVLSIMDVTDVIVLITTQEIPSIKNTKTFLSVVDGMRINRKRILHVMNRYDKRISIAPKKIGESLRQEIVAQIPLDERIVALSVNRGVPFMLDNKAQPVGKSITGLVDLIKDTVSKLATEEPERVAKKR
jgi:pilus assembly protein CpaE